MKTLTVTLLVLALSAALAQPLFAHCEVPCGIYGDKMRFDMIEEHITTIEKSMNQIVELSGAGEINYNQLVRWINNKDQHAVELQHIVSQYFLTQRIKPVDSTKGDDYAKYQKHLELCHKMIVHAMKSKQTTDLAHIEALRALNKEFRASYLGPEGEAHEH
jgi:nickel superoxide dismutase